MIPAGNRNLLYKQGKMSHIVSNWISWNCGLSQDGLVFNKVETLQRILQMPQKDVRRGVFKSIKDRIRKGADIKPHTKAVRRLLAGK